MVEGHLSRVVSINIISACIITFVVCYFLKTFHLTYIMHFADFFGLCFLVIFGINILVESGDVRNNYQRFLLAAALIIVFDLIFLILVPVLFGNVFMVPDYTLAFGEVTYSLTSNVFVYLVIYAVIMMIANLVLYFRDKKIYNLN